MSGRPISRPSLAGHPSASRLGMASASRVGTASRAGASSARVGVVNNEQQNGVAPKMANGSGVTPATATAMDKDKDLIIDEDAALQQQINKLFKFVKIILVLNIIIIILTLAAIALNFIGGGGESTGGCGEATLKKVVDESNDKLLEDLLVENAEIAADIRSANESLMLQMRSNNQLLVVRVSGMITAINDF